MNRIVEHEPACRCRLLPRRLRADGGLCATCRLAWGAAVTHIAEPTKNDQLEDISDRIRHGIPVSLFEAIAAIEYQEAMQSRKTKTPLVRLGLAMPTIAFWFLVACALMALTVQLSAWLGVEL